MGDNMVYISQKHGVNPSISRCFYCGKDKNEILLFGRLPNDVEAPMHSIINYEPCDACKELFKAGVLIIECTAEPQHTNQLAIQRGAYPTGNYVVITRDAAKRLFNNTKDSTILVNKDIFNIFRNTESRAV